MPVHETDGGYQYGKTGKVYKSKKKAIKQAIAIAYSKAEKKGRKPSQEEIKTEIKGNPEEKMNKTASALQKEASVRKQAADLKSWLVAARNFLNSDAAKRIGLGLGFGGGAYLLSGLFDKENKHWKERLGGSALVGGLAAWKGLDAARGLRNMLAAKRHANRVSDAVKRGTEAQKWRKLTLAKNIFADELDLKDALTRDFQDGSPADRLRAQLAPIKPLDYQGENLAERLASVADTERAWPLVDDASVGKRMAQSGTDYLLRTNSPTRAAADEEIIDNTPTSDPRWADALERLKIQYK